MRKLSFIPVLILLVSSMAFGHGVEALSIAADSVIAVEITYSTGEAMAYANISVFSPSSPTVEVMAGYADRKGRFAFIPDEDGVWRVEATDGMGHKAIVSADYTAASHEADGVKGNTAHKGGKSPFYLRALLGVSLIINIFAAYDFIRRRRNG